MKTHADTPACFGLSQYMAWLKVARLSAAASEEFTICDDCTPDFAAAMVADHRCQRDEWEMVKFGYRRPRKIKKRDGVDAR